MAAQWRHSGCTVAVTESMRRERCTSNGRFRFGRNRSGRDRVRGKTGERGGRVGGSGSGEDGERRC